MFSNDEWASLIISCCEDFGISQFCIAPGSRSTPLTLSIAARSHLTSHIHFEERGLSFFALGLAKSRNEPVAIVTTSGTAVANLLPAVVEAYYSQTPLLLLTADRPPELIGVGANQAIKQAGIFGAYVRTMCDLPCPEDCKNISEINDGLFSAIESLEYGPVHINVPFREPLFMPESESISSPNSLNNDKRISLSKKIDFEMVGDVLTSGSLLNDVFKKPLIVLGECSKEEYKSAMDLARCLSFPILTDVLSSYNLEDYKYKISQYDWFIDLEKYNNLKPDFVIWIGGRVLSKKLHNWIPSRSKILQFTSLLYPINPSNNKNLIKFDYKISKEVNDTLIRLLKVSPDDEWNTKWNIINKKTNDIIRTSIVSENVKHEPSIYSKLFTLISNEFPLDVKRSDEAGVNLFLANSSPIRHASNFIDQHGIEFSKIFANRGGSGIDGIVSSIAGYSSGSRTPLVAIVGDLSFLHDLSSVILLEKIENPCVLFVINNDGGGLFSWLAVQKSKFFTKYFKTPHGITCRSFCKGARVYYENPTSYTSVSKAFKKAIQRNKATVIEIFSDGNITPSWILENRKQINKFD